MLLLTCYTVYSNILLAKLAIVNDSRIMSTVVFGTKESYEAAEKWCDHVTQQGHDLFFSIDSFHSGIKKASSELKFPIESLSSFLRNRHLNHVKKKMNHLRTLMQSNIIDEYNAGVSILNLARRYNFPPAMFSRLLLENVTDLPKKSISNALRNPQKYLSVEHLHADMQSFVSNPIILDPFSGKQIHLGKSCTRLSIEVQEAINSDPLYGPRFDIERNRIGVEYEIMLARVLKIMGVSFETEEQLRVRGTSRTPDILFSSPVAVKVPKIHSKHSKGFEEIKGDTQWKMVCWIDSKALFGDVHTHATVLEQAETYIHRFGPGMILYWFGHAPRELLGDAHGDVVVIGWNLPKEFMLATGDITREGIHTTMSTT